MRKDVLAVAGLVLGLGGTYSTANAAVISSSPTAPSSSVLSQPDFSAAAFNGGQDFTDNAGPPAQTFTVGAAGFQLDKVTVKGFANTGASFGGMDGTTLWTLTISSVSAGVLTNITQESTQGFAPTDGSAYLTIDLATPVTLTANTQYAFAVHTSVGYFGLAKSTADVLANGAAIQHGSTARTASTGATAINTQTVDRTFFLAAVPEPTGIALLGAAGIGMLARRRRA
jgi:hypothetical protein